MALFLGLWIGSVASGAKDQTSAQDSPAGRPRDLTELSLEALLQFEITPINVLGSHTHLERELMVGYRYMYMDQRGNLDGSRKITNAEAFQRGYTVMHTSMTMEMHMVEVMYAPRDNVTVMAMAEYRVISMHHLRSNGTTFPSESRGFGDTTVMALYNIFGNPREGPHRILLNAGLSLPTGSIQKRFNSPDRLEYMMQLGSGTYDLLPGITYLGQSTTWAWGGQLIGTVRLDENDVGYRLGNRYRLSAWANYKLTESLGPSVRLDWQQWDNIHGSDPQLDAKRETNPAFNPNKQNGRRLDALVGLNYYVPRGRLKKHRFGLEGGIPVYESLAGPNPKTEWLLTLSWSVSFGGTPALSKAHK
ncbi:MAG: transporter [Opitutaceae bacterium]|nr:transporter [Opitutaceae bacterium]